MTSLKKRQANRANALKSTGPKTPAGMRSASLNATSHGLSVATDPKLLDPTAERVASLIASDGIDPDVARELAAKIIDYERNMAHQRSLSMPPPTIPPEVAARELERMQQDVPEIDMLLDDLERDLHTKGRVSPRKLRGHTRLIGKLTASWQKMQNKILPVKPSVSRRYLLRATNQLIKGLKRL
jgi:hypothetical protein